MAYGKSAPCCDDSEPRRPASTYDASPGRPSRSPDLSVRTNKPSEELSRSRLAPRLKGYERRTETMAREESVSAGWGTVHRMETRALNDRRPHEDDFNVSGVSVGISRVVARWGSAPAGRSSGVSPAWLIDGVRALSPSSRVVRARAQPKAANSIPNATSCATQRAPGQPPLSRAAPGSGSRRRQRASVAPVFVRSERYIGIMNVRGISLIVVLMLSVVEAACSTADQTPPASLSAGSYAAIIRPIKESVERGDLPGVVAQVVDRDGVLYEAAAGELDARSGSPMQLDAIFPVASMTKPVTSVAVMILLEEGHLELDAPVSMYLPMLEHPEVLTRFNPTDGTFETAPAKNVMTIRHLLTHTSGIAYGFTSPALARQLSSSPRGEWEFPLLHEPGERWTYGASTAVLGIIVEKITGEPLEAYFQRRIFQPLGMNDTSYAVASEKRSRVVLPSVRAEGGFAVAPDIVPGVPLTPPIIPPASVRGDYGLYSTAHDYGLFVRMLLNRGTLGSAHIISEDSVKLMGQNHIGSLFVEAQAVGIPELATLTRPFPLGAGRDKFGLGFQIASESDDTRTHRGAGSLSWAGIFNTEFWIDPELQLGAVHLASSLPFYDEGAIRSLREFEAAAYSIARHPAAPVRAAAAAGL